MLNLKETSLKKTNPLTDKGNKMPKQWTDEERKAFGEKIVLGSTQYRAVHQWVERCLGKPQRCEDCGDTTDRRYHWANLSGEYKRELYDWRRLCVPCHKKMDVKPWRVVGGLCVRGHMLTENNVYRRTNRPDIVECKQCVLDRQKAIRINNKQERVFL